MMIVCGPNGRPTPDEQSSDTPGNDDSQDSSDWTDEIEVENVEKEYDDETDKH